MGKILMKVRDNLIKNGNKDPEGAGDEGSGYGLMSLVPRRDEERKASSSSPTNKLNYSGLLFPTTTTTDRELEETRAILKEHERFIQRKRFSQNPSAAQAANAAIVTSSTNPPIDFKADQMKNDLQGQGYADYFIGADTTTASKAVRKDYEKRARLLKDAAATGIGDIQTIANSLNVHCDYQWRFEFATTKDHRQPPLYWRCSDSLDDDDGYTGHIIHLGRFGYVGGDRRVNPEITYAARLALEGEADYKNQLNRLPRIELFMAAR
jgi:hypothetical protein